MGTPDCSSRFMNGSLLAIGSSTLKLLAAGHPASRALEVALDDACPSNTSTLAMLFRSSWSLNSV